MVQNLLSRLIQPTASSSPAYPGRRVLGWAHSIRGLPWIGNSARINALKCCPRFAVAVTDCCACSVINYISDLHGREKRAAVAGN